MGDSPDVPCKKAFIKLGDEIIYDSLEHALGAISYSTAYHGFVPKAELLEHCYFDHRNPQWIPYHFRQS